MSKYDMSTTFSDLNKKCLETFVNTYRIPLDLHPHLPDPDLSMDIVPNDAIGIYTQFLCFSKVRIPFSTFLLSVLKYFKVHICQLAPLGLNKVVTFEIIYRDLGITPTVNLFWVFQLLCKQGDWFSFAKRRNTKDICMDVVLAPFGLTGRAIWFLEGKMITLVGRGDAKVVEEPHRFTDSILQRFRNHTNAPATEGAVIPLPTPKEVVASQPNPKLAKNSKALVKRKASTYLVGLSKAAQPKRKRRLTSKASKARSGALVVAQDDDVEDVGLSETDYCTFLEGNLERDEGDSFRAASTPVLRSGRRLRSPPPCSYNPILSDPSHADTSIAANVPSSDYVVHLRGTAPVGSARKAQMEYDEDPDDDFFTATLGEEIDLTLFPFALGPYCMSYLFTDGEGRDPPKYTKEE
ncbi:hypothetical protein Tco_0457936 [Tanacetum coccineum]